LGWCIRTLYSRSKKGIEVSEEESNFFAEKMTILQKFSHMESIRKLLDQAHTGAVRKSYHGVRIYKNINEILERFDMGRSISCLYNDDRKNEFIVPYSTKKRKFTVLIFNMIPGSGMDNGCRLAYAKFEIAKLSDPIDFDKSMLDIGEGIVDQYCLMLPFKNKDSTPLRSAYSVITHKWLVMSEEGALVTGNLCDSLFCSAMRNY